MSTGNLLTPPVPSGFVDLASPPAIGNNVPNAARFTTITGSRTLGSTTPLVNNTTLVRATHIGQSWLINGGTINLPLDADWQLGDEIWLVVSGTTQTNVNGNGATIKLGPFGAFTTTTIAGVDGQQACFKKIGTNNVACYFAYHFFSGMIDGAIASPTAGDTLQWDAVNSKWANTPGALSVEETIRRAYLLPSAGSTTTQIGLAATIVGTTAHPQGAATSVYTRSDRFTVTSAPTAGTLASIRIANLKLWRGNASGLGGFKIIIPFGGATLVAGMRAFVGISSATAAATNVDPLVDIANSKLGMACNNNTGTWTFIYGVAGAAPTQVVLSAANFPIDATTWYELILECLPNAAFIRYTIRNRSNGTSTTGDLNANIPVNTTYMHLYAWACNNATAAAVALAYGQIKMSWRD